MRSDASPSVRSQVSPSGVKVSVARPGRTLRSGGGARQGLHAVRRRRPARPRRTDGRGEAREPEAHRERASLREHRARPLDVASRREHRAVGGEDPRAFGPRARRARQREGALEVTLRVRPATESGSQPAEVAPVRTLHEEAAEPPDEPIAFLVPNALIELGGALRRARLHRRRDQVPNRDADSVRRSSRGKRARGARAPHSHRRRRRAPPR